LGKSPNPNLQRVGCASLRVTQEAAFRKSSSCPGKSAKRVFALDVPGIHAFATFKRKTWMAGTTPGHDEKCQVRKQPVSIGCFPGHRGIGVATRKRCVSRETPRQDLRRAANFACISQWGGGWEQWGGGWEETRLISAWVRHRLPGPVSRETAHAVTFDTFCRASLRR
jgi:hypothetical protein